MQALLIFSTLFISCLSAPSDSGSNSIYSPNTIRMELNTTLQHVSYMYDSDIGFFLLCDTIGGKTKKCPMILYQKSRSKEDGDPLMAVCHTSFSQVRGLLHQGCINLEASYVKKMCTVDRCGSNARARDIHFCCCIGHRCNSNYYVRKNVEDSMN